MITIKKLESGFLTFRKDLSVGEALTEILSGILVVVPLDDKGTTYGLLSGDRLINTDPSTILEKLDPDKSAEHLSVGPADEAHQPLILLYSNNKPIVVAADISKVPSSPTAVKFKSCKNNHANYGFAGESKKCSGCEENVQF